MSLPRTIEWFSRVPLAFSLLGASVLPGAAQERELFTWSGRVDREIRITHSGRDAWIDGEDRYRSSGRLRVTGVVPRGDGRVDVRVDEGRGEIDILQQPSARNDYTTVVRVRDRSGGADGYRIRAYWRPAYDRAGPFGGRIGDILRERDRGRASGEVRGRGRDRDRWDERDRFGRIALRWSGRVDDLLEIRMRGRRVEYRTLRGRSVRDVRTDIARVGLPREDVNVRIERHDGRGTIRVVQQPSARNGYTAVVHVRDPHSGYGRYAFDVSWTDGRARRW